MNKPNVLMSGNTSKPHTLSPHPGVILKGELEEHRLSQRELASAIGKSAPMINGILNGSKDITVEMAILLEAALPGGLKAVDWLRLQNEHDVEARREEKSVASRIATIEMWNSLREHTNLNAIRRRLELGSDFENGIKVIMDTLGAANQQELERRLSVADSCFKKSAKVQTDTANLLAWTIIVKHASRQQKLGAEFDREQLAEITQSLNAIFFANTAVVEKTQELLNRYGIKFIASEKRLDKVPVDGYSFWIDENPTIVVTQRMNRIDNLAFTIMHELGHIAMHLNGDGEREFLDVDYAIMHVNEQEKEANAYAEASLLGNESPAELFGDIVNPYASAKTLESIARRKRINVGIVVGQYQFFCNRMGLVKNSYAICRDLIPKVG